MVMCLDKTFAFLTIRTELVIVGSKIRNVEKSA